MSSKVKLCERLHLWRMQEGDNKAGKNTQPAFYKCVKISKAGMTRVINEGY